MIGFSYFLILWLGVGFLTGFKALFVDQVYDEGFKQELSGENCWTAEEELIMLVIDNFFVIQFENNDYFSHLNWMVVGISPF